MTEKKNIENIKKKNTSKNENLNKNAGKLAKSSEKIEKIDNFSFGNEFLIEKERSLTDIVFANLIVLFAIFLSAFVPIFSLALPFLVMIYFEVGLFGFILKNERGDKYRFEDLFISLKTFIKIFCIYVVKMALIIFWSCLFIVPGVIVMLNYSFCGIIVFEEKNLDARGVLMLSKEMTKGYRWNIFFYELLALASICVAMSLMFLFILFFDVFFFVPAYFYILFVVLAGVLDFVLVALPIVEIAIVDNFIKSKQEKVTKLI